ncbi:MAG: anti-sigma B factor antagonist [Flavobacteriales bacterium]|jgi:anti-sigma B factor antagonist|tara:strand:- start:1810 stop:2187 length:378 start_codon:yes stop_codon:yes gene_type:complete
MNFTIDKQEKYTSIKVHVEKLDTTVAPALKSELVMLNAHGAKNLIIDLEETRYCDSSGLSAILVANRLCKNVNGTFVLTGLQESVTKLISISQLDTILNITPTAKEAVDFVFMTEVEKDLESSED